MQPWLSACLAAVVTGTSVLTACGPRVHRSAPKQCILSIEGPLTLTQFLVSTGAPTDMVLLMQALQVGVTTMAALLRVKQRLLQIHTNAPTHADAHARTHTHTHTHTHTGTVFCFTHAHRHRPPVRPHVCLLVLLCTPPQTASKVIASKVARAGLEDLGATVGGGGGDRDSQKALDVVAVSSDRTHTHVHTHTHTHTHTHDDELASCLAKHPASPRSYVSAHTCWRTQPTTHVLE